MEFVEVGGCGRLLVFRAAFKLDCHVFCVSAQNHKIGNTSTSYWVLRSNELTQENEIFNIYEMNSHQPHFSLNMDVFRSSCAN